MAVGRTGGGGLFECVRMRSQLRGKSFEMLAMFFGGLGVQMVRRTILIRVMRRSAVVRRTVRYIIAWDVNSQKIEGTVLMMGTA